MRKKIIILIGVLFLIFIIFKKYQKIEYDSDNNKLQECVETKVIKDTYKADSVVVRKTILKEEIYFPTIIAVDITIYNPTMKSLDYKKLPRDEYIRLENYEEIETKIRAELEYIAIGVLRKCDLKGYNDIMITTLILDNDKKDHYSFLSHYYIKDNKLYNE